MSRSLRERVSRWCATAALSLVSVALINATQPQAAIGTGALSGEVRALTMHNLHTEETATIVFKRGGTYDQDGLRAMDQFLRDPIDKKSTYDMDPHLFDLLWEAYQATGSNATIEVLDGYRAPATNEYLRKNSDGVAENSLHMKGQAIDFYIPGVPLATLRNIGLKMQAGGVGFYPDSGSPFVHLDTGSVRHWPLLSRQQLLAVFPDGKTIDIPADGNPLPGYKEALAAYQQKQADLTPKTQVASFSPTGQQTRPGLFGKIVQAVAGTDQPVQVASAATPATPAAPAVAASTAKSVGVASTSYLGSGAGSDPLLMAPKPNLAPRLPQTVTTVQPSPAAISNLITASIPARAATSPRAADFASPDLWNAPAVPASLQTAMASRERRQPGAAVPIAPTAVVATVSVSRAMAAEAITTAVIKGGNAAVTPVVLAYASDTAPAAPAAKRPAAVVPLSAVVPAAVALPALTAPAPPLTMTALDTAGLRLWMGPASTRQRGYAVLTMPEFLSGSGLMSAMPMTPVSASSEPLRTDRFTPVAH